MRQGAVTSTRGYVVVVSAAIVAHAVVGPGAAWVPYLLVSAAAGWATLMGLRRHEPPDPVPWRLLAVGIGLALAGSVLWYGLELSGRDPGIAHVVYLAAFVVATAAAWLVGRRRSRAERTVALLDTAIVTAGVAILMWVFVAAPTWTNSPVVGVERAVRTAYPMLSLAMLAATVRLAFGGGARVRAYWLLLGGLTGFFAGDLLHAVTSLHGVAAEAASSTIRLGGLALVGAAALHPSMRYLGAPGTPAPVQLSRPRLAMLWIASAAGPVTLLVRLGSGAYGELGVISLGSLVLFTLVIARAWGLFQMLAEFVRREQEDRFRALVENADDVIVIVGIDGTITYVSPSCERVWGYDADRFATDARAMLDPTDLRRLQGALHGLLRSPPGGTATLAGRVRHADGTWRRGEATLVDRRDDPAIGGVVLTARDVTTRWGLEQRLAHQALHDPLTGLPNRALFVNRVEQALGATSAEETFVAVLLLDIDDFKNINEVLGQERGDVLLQVVGGSLAAAIRRHDTVARIGGDEFGILLPEMSSLHEVTEIAAQLLDEIGRTVPADRDDLEVRASLGIATSTARTSAHDLLREADAAMYGAKRENRASFRLFDADMHADAVQRLQLKMDLRTAVEHDELAVLYQPIYELAGETMVGMEALLRWHHPTRGLISPLEFIPLAEESGTIGSLGEFVLRRACLDVANHRRRTGRDVFATVNVSPIQLNDVAFAAAVEDALRSSQLPAAALTLELTESIFLEESEAIRDALRRLRRVGVHLAIDDFGTGYCSLGYLNRFRFDVVKIDKSFIDVLGVPDGDRRLTLGMMELVGSLEVPAVAEGVETREQLEALRVTGCPYGQGYLWSRPVPIDELSPIAAASVAASNGRTDGSGPFLTAG